ncbi:winged helix-turn-helix domain-containing protein [Actinophytocola sp. KF-1]
MLRVHFTLDDLLRVRVLDEPHPLWETLLSMHMVQTQQGAVVFGEWRRLARAALRPSTRALMALARPQGYSPDFLTPAVESADLDTALEALLSTERRVLRADIGVLAAERAVPAWMRDVADGDVPTLSRLADGIRHYHRTVLAPHWSTIRAHVRENRARRAELVVSRGLEHVLHTLHAGARWDGQVLALPYPVDQDLHLRGRGLTLVPSFFCWQNPITLADQDRQPVLVYPVERGLDWVTTTDAGQPRRSRSLVALLGRTRAAVLLTIAERPHVNTTELAAALGTSPASASQHATVLRDAGLVITRRHHGSARHTLSDRGALLLEVPYADRAG